MTAEKLKKKKQNLWVFFDQFNTTQDMGYIK